MPKHSAVAPLVHAHRGASSHFAAMHPALAIGSRLLPKRTAVGAGRLFMTPHASSRLRARLAESYQSDQTMQRGQLRVGNLRIGTYTWGDPSNEPYALLAHGWSSFGLRFLPWVSHLRAMGLAVVTFDQPGHGFSSSRYCTLPDFVNVTNKVGSRLGPAAVAIGHSLGGAAIALAQDETWHAQKLILLAPVEDMVAATERFFRQAHLGTRLRAPFFAWFGAHTGVHPQDLQLHRHLPALGQPGLIVHDLNDEDVPWEEGERYARHWHSSRLLTTQGLGHHRIVDAPEVIEASLGFLRGEAVGERVVGSPNLPFGL